MCAYARRSQRKPTCAVRCASRAAAGQLSELRTELAQARSETSTAQAAADVAAAAERAALEKLAGTEQRLAVATVRLGTAHAPASDHARRVCGSKGLDVTRPCESPCRRSWEQPWSFAQPCRPQPQRVWLRRSVL